MKRSRGSLGQRARTVLPFFPSILELKRQGLKATQNAENTIEKDV
jgi:hypothetical protein